MQRIFKVIKWATDLAVKKKGKGKEESEIKDHNRFAKNKFWLTAKLTREGLIQATNLFETGHFCCKIFATFSMKQVCKLGKKINFHVHVKQSDGKPFSILRGTS